MTNSLQSNYKSQGNKHPKLWVFKRLQKTDRDGADVTMAWQSVPGSSSGDRKSSISRVRRRHHCLSVVHGCQPSVIELFRSPLLVPATLCQAMSRPHHLCQFSVAT